MDAGRDDGALRLLLRSLQIVHPRPYSASLFSLCHVAALTTFFPFLSSLSSAPTPTPAPKNLTTTNALDTALKRLFYVRMRLGEFDPASTNPYRQIPRSVIESAEHMQLNKDMSCKFCVSVIASPDWYAGSLSTC